MKATRKVVLRPAEGWPKGWYYCGEAEAVSIEVVLDPDGFLNRTILERPTAPAATRQPDSTLAPLPESKE